MFIRNRKKQRYELQEHCGKLATTTWNKENGGENVTNTPDGQMVMSYQNHYSPTLNKCFFLETGNSYNYKHEPRTSTKIISLFDLNENREFGTFIKSDNEKAPFLCVVAEKKCHSGTEWDALIKPYMEDTE
jgi:hypothetical protein